MEKLVEQLIEKHQLDRKEALDAIRLITDYLKIQNPALQKLIDHALPNPPDET